MTDCNVYIAGSCSQLVYANMLNRQTVANKDYILTCTVMGDIHKQWFQLGVFLFCMVHSLTAEAIKGTVTADQQKVY